tara:strand:+ start:340 stop:483 length:144 start_codon:yes stop_codon:yes gene_type:complete
LNQGLDAQFLHEVFRVIVHFIDLIEIEMEENRLAAKRWECALLDTKT